MRKRILTLILCLSMILGNLIGFPVTVNAAGAAPNATVSYLDGSDLLYDLMETATTFVVAQQKALGASHYAYTEALYEESTGEAASGVGTEMQFHPGSRLVMITLEAEGDRVKKTETVILNCESGVVRDPDVSADGTRLLFSMKAFPDDDFHIYEMDLTSPEFTYEQLTFGSGVADFECKYLPNGEILFQSSRAIQTVDCWKTPVSNLYKMSADGKNIVRLGYDQVHTTYPTLTEDGRVIYTRWDYNDRTQMWIQGVFQMNPDGTSQTELYGNNSNFPTTLLHTRQIPGEPSLYVSVASGHHTLQAGKLCIVDVSKGRDGAQAISFPFPDNYTTTKDSVDAYGQSGALYKYPYPISATQYLVSYSATGWAADKWKTPFDIVLMEEGSDEQIVICEGTPEYPASQIVPVKTSDVFVRPSMVDYSKNTGTYYVGDVYQGEAMVGIERGTVKQLRVVALDYRAYAVGATIASGSGTADPFTPIATGNGAWDVKVVLGVATVYEDGSALFSVPSETPVYFQLLDADGNVIQTMRSWSTLMPNEIYSCVGCHEDNNTAPPAAATTTMALRAGVETLQPESWQVDNDPDFDPYTTDKGFDYLEEVQPILDANCVSCHNNTRASYDKIEVANMRESGVNASSVKDMGTPFSLESDNIGSSRMSRYFPLSYLVLTGSVASSGVQWVGKAENSYTHWLSSMSGPEIQQPATFGSLVSRLTTMLKEGHQGVELTDAEYRAIAAWIDLCVPAYGTYDANNHWDSAEMREAEEEQNKRDHYTMLNDYARMALSGRLPEGLIKAVFTDQSTGRSYKDEAQGILQLYVPVRYQTGDSVTVTLPEGQKYIGFTISPKMGESIIYCPDGTFTYFLPEVSTMATTIGKDYANTKNYVTIRILTSEELAAKRNLAENAYDYSEKTAGQVLMSNQYPHATASSEWENSPGQTFFYAKNAIDGFANNRGHGGYPVQSWGPAPDPGQWLEIDFGRPVNAEEVGIVIRYDLPHDTYFESAVIQVTYEDGTTSEQTITIQCVGTEQIFVLDLYPKPITKLRIMELVAHTSGGWAAITELKVYGAEVIQ